MQDNQVRLGKTKKDRASGALARTANNKEQRALWMNGSERVFPDHTLGGKGNSSKALKRGRGGLTRDYSKHSIKNKD